MLVWTVITFVFGILLMPLIRKLAFLVGAVDAPRDRHAHIKPTATLGGLGIFISFITVFFLSPINHENTIPLLVGTLIIVVTGVIDDVKELSPKLKLAGQVAASLCVTIWGGIMVHHIYLPFLGRVEFGYFAIPISIFWILAIVNAINLIDGIDGLAGGVSTIALVTIGGMALLLGNTGSAFTAFLLVGALLAFLVFNFPPASIFMGDTGAMFVGFMIAILSLLEFKNVTLISLLIPIIILGVPFTDTFFAIIRRIKQRTSISTADRSHIHHRLLALGLTNRQTVLLLYLIAAVFSGISFLLYFSTTWGSIILIIVLLLLIEIAVEFIGLIDENHHPLLNLYTGIGKARKKLYFRLIKRSR
ncbi:hypothetical protein MFLO_01200 [Listeria floridensis FSL S10-1187]|uniref:Undacaprenyl-phosphate N-acetylglucosaminyltransferase n=1 Tax=Listeria floridensis FSL S10-1187 TaxID=1265817 RepID=A0ABP3B1J3_9LIST|nr:MraY family glycosyltransferase [Listeria floridensis]EUJ33804.1 hypothetical protein MFLO_01200 [Listeria floridensis FSL S10-1187]